MVSSNFVDYVKINCRSGNGGSGFAHFYPYRLTALGGPEGGDEGLGGHIILRGKKQKVNPSASEKFPNRLNRNMAASGGEKNKTG